MGISTHNGTLTISTQQETDPGYDMGANHTYRYIKTSGLGTLPLKWVGDSFSGTTTWYDNNSGMDTLYTFGYVITWISKTAYNAQVNLDGDAVNRITTCTGIQALRVTYKIEINSGSLSSSAIIVDNCKIPSIYQITFGPSGGNPDENNYVNDIPTTGLRNVRLLGTSAVGYWLSDRKNSSTMWCVNSSRTLSFQTWTNNGYITPFAVIPF